MSKDVFKVNMEEPKITPPFFSKSETRVRSLVLSFSLQIEAQISQILGIILNIREPSRSLGNNSSSLSLNQKVNLMLDTGYFEKEDTKHIIVFMEIRNQFMHNVRAKSFIDCLGYLNGRKNFLKKTYSNEIEDEEKSLEQCWTDLTADVLSSLKEAIKKIKENGPKKLGENITLYFNQSFDEE